MLSDKLYYVMVIRRSDDEVVHDWKGLAPTIFLAKSRAWYNAVHEGDAKRTELNSYKFEYVLL